MRDVQGVSILLSRVKELRSTEADLENSRGEAERLAGVRMTAADEQWANLMQNLDLLRATVGETLLPLVNRVIPRLATGLKSLRGWAEANKGLSKFAAEAAAWGAAILIPLGAIAMLGASLSFISSYVPLVLKLLNPVRLVSLATKAWSGYLWVLNAAMDANPIVLFVAAAAALAVAGYEVYEHWSTVKAVFKAVGAEFVKLWNEAYNWGANLLKRFGEGIASAAMWPVHAIENVVGKMGRFVLGHSPIPEGPLRDLNLGRDLARTITPGPVLAAIRNVAMVTAIAAPMMVGAGAPALAARGAAASGGAPINITVHYHVTAGSPEEFVKAARKHAEELTRILKDRAAVHARREFD